MMRGNLFDDGSADHEHPGHVRVACIYLHETEKAVRIDAGTKALWVPRSCVPPEAWGALPLNPGTSFTLPVKEWFAKKEGLI